MGKNTDDPKGKRPLPIDEILKMDLEAPERAGKERRAGEPAESGSGRGLRDTVTGVAHMLRDLEAQLSRVMAVNERLEKELADARSARRTTEKERDELAERLARTQADGVTLEDVRAEVLTLQRERRDLAERLQASLEQGRKLEEKVRQAEQRAAELVVERDDALEDVWPVEEQLSRAVAIVAELRRRDEELVAQRDQLGARVRQLEGELGAAAEQGEALRLELEESRGAIEEIRRSILEVGAGAEPRA
jgi:chromosome segregation ATPase